MKNSKDELLDPDLDGLFNDDQADALNDELEEVIDNLPEDGGDLQESENTSPKSDDQDEEFNSITETDEPKTPIGQLYDAADKLTHGIRNIRWNSSSFYANGIDASQKVGIGSNAVTFNKATTGKDGGWVLTLNLPNNVAPKSIGDVREGVLRVIIVPEEVSNPILNEAIDTLIENLQLYTLV